MRDSSTKPKPGTPGSPDYVHVPGVTYKGGKRKDTWLAAASLGSNERARLRFPTQALAASFKRDTEAALRPVYKPNKRSLSTSPIELTPHLACDGPYLVSVEPAQAATEECLHQALKSISAYKSTLSRYRYRGSPATMGCLSAAEAGLYAAAIPEFQKICRAHNSVVDIHVIIRKLRLGPQDASSAGRLPSFTSGQVAAELGISGVELKRQVEASLMPPPAMRYRHPKYNKTVNHYSAMQLACIKTGGAAQLASADSTHKFYLLLIAGLDGVVAAYTSLQARLYVKADREENARRCASNVVPLK